MGALDWVNEPFRLILRDTDLGLDFGPSVTLGQFNVEFGHGSVENNFSLY